MTAAQLTILQSPITSLISTISMSVNVKLDDSNYLNWHFHMQLMLESNGIMGFVDGSNHYPVPNVYAASGINSSYSSTSKKCDELLIWKMHDRAVMQLITATLSPVAMSCAIGSQSSQELWVHLKEQFFTVSRTSIFQMKSNLQNTRKGSDNRLLAAAGVYFADEGIVILALNGLPLEYNTFRCVVRGRESVISLKFRSQLLAEKKSIVDNVSVAPSYLTAMAANSGPPMSQAPLLQQSTGSHGQSSYLNGGYKSFNRNKGKGNFN
ncbi:unnamed protein product [Malus baccata var. baccata]